MTAKTYTTLPSFPEIMIPIVKMLSQISSDCQFNFPSPTVQSRCRGLLDEVNASIARVVRRRMPVVQSFLLKPDTIKQYDPVFVENYVPGKDYNHDREKAEIKKLSKKVKKEKKGAIKELRRDTIFIAKEKERIQAFQDRKRARAVKAITTMLENEQRDTNIFDRISKKRKQQDMLQPEFAD